jgi:hypothetical protein
MSEQFRRQDRQGYSGTGGQAKTLDELWPQYLRNGYFDALGNLRAEFLDRKNLFPLVKEMSEVHPPLTMHQARRFFQHCRAIEARLRARTSNWGTEEPAFRKIDAAAADAFGKSQRKIPELFHDFVKRNVAAVRSETDFLKGFLPHFEGLIGFGSLVLGERERR